MSSAMSGTRLRISTMPAACMVLAGDTSGGVSARAHPVASSNMATADMTVRCRGFRSITGMLPGESQILEIGAGVGIGVDQHHAQLAVATGRKHQPGIRHVAFPLHQKTLADAHHRT